MIKMKDLLQVCENNGIELVWKIMVAHPPIFDAPHDVYLVLTDKAIFALDIFPHNLVIEWSKHRMLTEKHPPEPFFKKGLLRREPVDVGEKLLWGYWLDRKRGVKSKMQAETIDG